MSVVTLATAKSASQEARENTVRILEEALQFAKEGQISELVLMCKRPDGSWCDERTPTLGFCEWIGRLEIMKHSWTTAYLNE